jgi:hypothetical protein
MLKLILYKIWKIFLIGLALLLIHYTVKCCDVKTSFLSGLGHTAIVCIIYFEQELLWVTRRLYNEKSWIICLCVILLIVTLFLGYISITIIILCYLETLYLDLIRLKEIGFIGDYVKIRRWIPIISLAIPICNYFF